MGQHGANNTEDDGGTDCGLEPVLRLEASGKLQEEVQVLRAENAKLEALLDQALKTLHHERLMHFGEGVSVDSGDRSEPDFTRR